MDTPTKSPDEMEDEVRKSSSSNEFMLLIKGDGWKQDSFAILLNKNWVELDRALKFWEDSLRILKIFQVDRYYRHLSTSTKM